MRKLGIGSVIAGAVPGAGALATLSGCALIWGIQEPIPIGDDGTSEASNPDQAAGDDAAGDDAGCLTDAQDAEMDGPTADARTADAAEAGEASTPGYAISTPTPVPAFIDACSLPGVMPVLGCHDNASISGLNMPFSFSFYGLPATKYWINTNGVLGFGLASSSLPRVACPLPNTSPDPYPAIYAFGDDLYTRNGVCFSVVGQRPSRQFVVTWEDALLNMTHSGHLTFSVVLTETSNTIDLMYETMTGGPEAQGTLAAIGIEDTSGTLFTQFSCDTASITTTPFDVRFTPTP
jgi:hypothetical protein